MLNLSLKQSRFYLLSEDMNMYRNTVHIADRHLRTSPGNSNHCCDTSRSYKPDWPEFIA